MYLDSCYIQQPSPSFLPIFTRDSELSPPRRYVSYERLRERRLIKHKIRKSEKCIQTFFSRLEINGHNQNKTEGCKEEKAEESG